MPDENDHDPATPDYIQQRRAAQRAYLAAVRERDANRAAAIDNGVPPELFDRWSGIAATSPGEQAVEWTVVNPDITRRDVAQVRSDLHGALRRTIAGDAPDLGASTAEELATQIEVDENAISDAAWQLDVANNRGEALPVPSETRDLAQAMAQQLVARAVTLDAAGGVLTPDESAREAAVLQTASTALPRSSRRATATIARLAKVDIASLVQERLADGEAAEAELRSTLDPRRRGVEGLDPTEAAGEGLSVAPDGLIRSRLSHAPGSDRGPRPEGVDHEGSTSDVGPVLGSRTKPAAPTDRGSADR